MCYSPTNCHDSIGVYFIHAKSEEITNRWLVYKPLLVIE